MRIIIFDFDNCLVPGNAVGEDVLHPLFTLLENSENHLSAEQFAEMKADFWRKPLDYIAEKFKFSEKSTQAGLAYFRQLEAKGSIKGYADSQLVHTMPGTKYLVTSGFESFQRSKIAAAGLSDAFKDVFYDDPGEPPRKGKAFYFDIIAKAENLSPKDIWVIGDSAESEIAAGNSLGMRTVQILRPGVTKSDNARYHVSSLTEFQELMEQNA